MTTKNKLHFLLITLIFGVISCKEIKQEKSKETELSEEILPKEDNIFSTLISKNGTIVFQEYYNGKTNDSLCDVQSLTKGIISILIGIAIDKEYIKSVDEPIEKYFPNEFKNLADNKKKAITIRHILNQTSGLSWKGYLEHEDWLNSEDPVSFVLKKDLENEPGENYNYNSGATHLLSVIISKTTGKTTLEFANEVLFQPLNTNLVDWQKRNKGYYDGSGLGLKMKPIDLMKIGQLLEKNGVWNGEQIVSEKWIQKLFDENEKSKTEWGLQNSKHGFCWYKSEFRGNKVDYGMGYGGQFIIMIPNKELIIVTTHNHDTPNGIEQQIEFLKGKLPKLIEKYGS
ncbi:serine hydrolase domain-containing protein [Maribacter sp. IgM3_T14_3]|uniref:serine hydrolase domain-containing protein n=1 Tax=Maribacter sp. IgM3_T14_3 TaxID=3415140 RepID=UPI003C7015B1